MINFKRHYLVVPLHRPLESYISPKEAVAAAFKYAEGDIEVRVFAIIQEIDLGEWERCPECGAAVEKDIWCWSEECALARGIRIGRGGVA